MRVFRHGYDIFCDNCGEKDYFPSGEPFSKRGWVILNNIDLCPTCAKIVKDKYYEYLINMEEKENAEKENNCEQ